jgi:hypothetical protein
MSTGFFDAIANDEVTLHGLEKWTCYLYENLGWMTLAYENGREDKVSSYLVSIKKLKLSIESRLKIITSEDAKLDLTTLLSKIKHLYKIASKLFDKQYIRKTVCDKCALPVGKNANGVDDDSDYVNVEESKINHLKQDGGSKNKKSVKSLKVIKVSKDYDLDNKKGSKKSSKKLSKKTSKTDSKKILNTIQNKPLIKKLSKKSSKKTSKKNSKIFRKM